MNQETELPRYAGPELAQVWGLVGDAGVGKTTALSAFIDLYPQQVGIISLEGGKSMEPLKSWADKFYCIPAIDFETYGQAFKRFLDAPNIRIIATDTLSYLTDEVLYLEVNPFKEKIPVLDKEGRVKSMRDSTPMDKAKAYGDVGALIAGRLFFSRIVNAKRAGKILLDIFHAATMKDMEGGPVRHEVKLPGNMARNAFHARYDFIGHLVIEATGLTSRTRSILTIPDGSYEAKSREDARSAEEYPVKVAMADFPGFINHWLIPSTSVASAPPTTGPEAQQEMA